MKALALAAVLALIVAVPAEAASKKRNASVKRPAAAMVQKDSNAVYAADGYVLGADPDPFIRLMMRMQGKPQDQSGI